MRRAEPGAPLTVLLLLALALSPCTRPSGGPGVAGERTLRTRSQSPGLSSPWPAPAELPVPPAAQGSPGPILSFALSRGLEELLLGPRKALAF